MTTTNVKVIVECPNCGHENVFETIDFIMHNIVCDYQSIEFNCEKCNEEIEVHLTDI